MSNKNIQAQITDEVTSWEGVTAQPHRFGGVQYAVGRREIGHMHGDYQVDIPFPRKVRDQLVKAGRAQPHHILPETGWITFYLRRPQDAQHAVELLAESYQIAINQKKSKGARTEIEQ